MIKSIGTNCPVCRGAEHPAFDPLKINESRFPDGMRFKEVNWLPGNDENHIRLDWLTQEPYTESDVDLFIEEVSRAVRANKYTGKLTIEIQDRDYECRPVKRTLTFKEV